MVKEPTPPPKDLVKPPPPPPPPPKRYAVPDRPAQSPKR